MFNDFAILIDNYALTTINLFYQSIFSDKFFKNQENSLNCWEFIILLNSTSSDINTLFSIINSPYFIWNFKSTSSLYLYYYLDIFYSFIVNTHNILITKTKQLNILFNRNLIFSFKCLKWSHIGYLFILVYISRFNTLFNNFSQNLSKIFVLFEVEKELGSLEDSISFILLFLSFLLTFVVFTVVFFILYTIKISWFFNTLIIISLFILTIPLNVFLDFGINFAAYIKGSSLSNNLLVEGIFDLIATFIVIIRFIVQNIRFVFIFGAIFELLEWCLNTSSNYFNNQTIYCESFFSNNLDLVNKSSFNALFINSILLCIYYLYYTLHLIFILFIQVSIYVLVSIWLFFFLYTTFFLSKLEKFFMFKKLI